MPKIGRLGPRLVRTLMDGPAKVRDRLEDLRKRRHCIAHPTAVLFPSSEIHTSRGFDRIQIGAHTRLLGRIDVLAHGGMVKIGEYCFVGQDTKIWSSASIEIGDRVLISHGVNIHDNNAHSLSANNRHEHFKAIFASGHPTVLEDVPAKPIVIEDDAWIGFNSTILKGVTIGRGAIVGANTVVTKDVAPYTVVVGNPSHVIGQSYP